jgi:5-methylcytosine-specific restriction endonuclease McrA
VRQDTATARGGVAARPHHRPSDALHPVRLAEAPVEGIRPSAANLRRVLLLNASREPLCVVSVHRAVTLVLSGKAVVLEEDAALLRSERLSLPAPQVLCLTRYVHVPYRSAVPPTRRTVLQRDSHRCAYCAAPADTVDHVHPRSRGGRHEWTNVVAACARCNHRKADRLLSEIGWQLLVTPGIPRASCALIAAAVRPHPSWTAYLAV